MVIAQSFTAESKKCRVNCRSSGWAPLVYPASALMQRTTMSDSIPFDDTTEVNPYFPLDRHVLMASIRELLILDATIDSKTLVPSINKAACMSHINPQATKLQNKDLILYIDRAKVKSSKRKARTRNSPRKKLKLRNTNIVNVSQGDEGKDDVVLQFEETQSAESIAEKILLRVFDPTPQHERITTDPTASPETDEEFERLPRKVSDVDMELHSSVSELQALMNLDAGDKDISRYVDLSQCGPVIRLTDSLPKFLETSIVFETKLRGISNRIVSGMLKSFENSTIRLFMGYRTKSLKRDKVLRMVSDFLFDVSHAMFAWKQTEGEVLADRSIATPTLQSFTHKIDSLVRDSLFDSRALKKIGGFDDSSILKHAVEIGRSARKQQSWEEFAKTVTGRRLLAHHRSGDVGAVGVKRRGRRIRYKHDGSSSCDSTEDLPRSRASSIGSTDDLETAREGKMVVPKEEPPNISSICDVSEITLHRESEKLSWGIKLAREGDICVVDRANNGSLQCGDMILATKNERNEVAGPPTSGETSDSWFQEVVNLFKTSNKLTLVVRRVGL